MTCYNMPSTPQNLPDFALAMFQILAPQYPATTPPLTIQISFWNCPWSLTIFSGLPWLHLMVLPKEPAFLKSKLSNHIKGISKQTQARVTESSSQFTRLSPAQFSRVTLLKLKPFSLFTGMWHCSCLFILFESHFCRTKAPPPRWLKVSKKQQQHTQDPNTY